MSRIGRAPVSIPSGVTVKYDAGDMEVKGPKGILRESLPTVISVEIGESEFSRDVFRPLDQLERPLAVQ